MDEQAWQKWIKAGGEYRQRQAAKAYARQLAQTFDLAAAINNDEYDRYIRYWYPFAALRYAPSGPSFTVIHSDEIVGIEVIGKLAIDEAELPEGFWTYAWSAYEAARAPGSTGDPQTVGTSPRPAVTKLHHAHQTCKEVAYTISTGFFCYCLMALGRILSLFDKAGRD